MAQTPLRVKEEDGGDRRQGLIGKLCVDVDLLPAVEEAGFEWLRLGPREALQVAELPLHHRDPFDLLLVAQSRVNDLVLVTDDAKIADYDCRIL